jgi:hypothetical protein
MNKPATSTNVSQWMAAGFRALGFRESAFISTVSAFSDSAVKKVSVYVGRSPPRILLESGLTIASQKNKIRSGSRLNNKKTATEIMAGRSATT